MQNFEIVIPIYWDALDIAVWGTAYIQKYLKPKRITFVGPAKMRELLPIGENVFFMDGNLIANGLSKESIAEIIRKAAPGGQADKRAGWYLQQMIKLGWARKSKEEAYLVWDADTIPLMEIRFYDVNSKKSIFLSGGRHHHLIYYKAISRLFGMEVNPSRENTYVAHYMLIQNHIMLDMLDKIEANQNIQGSRWWEKIMYSIDERDIGESGFSEFETYGEFVNLYYPQDYIMENDIRKYTSSRIFLGNHPAEDVLCWAGKDYDILGFEARDPVNPFWKRVCDVLHNKVSYQSIINVYHAIQKCRFCYLKEKLQRGVKKIRKRLEKQRQAEHGE